MSRSEFILPPDLQDFVTGKVACGDYATENEVVREAVRLLRERDRVRESHIAELREELRPALESLDRGEGAPLDVEEIKRRGRERQSNSIGPEPCRE